MGFVAQPARVEVDIAADDARVRNALTAIVSAISGFVVSPAWTAAQAIGDRLGPDRIVLCDLDSTPLALLTTLVGSGPRVIALGNSAASRSVTNVEFVDKGAAPDALAAALARAAAYVNRHSRAGANVPARSRPSTDVPSGLPRRRSHSA